MLNELDVVVALVDKDELGVVRGQSGTVVLVVAPDVYEVDFIGHDGRSYAHGAFRSDELLKLVSTPRPEIEAA